MVKSLLGVLRLFVSVPFFELVGAALVIAGVWELAGVGWAAIAAGACCLLKSFDLALARNG